MFPHQETRLNPGSSDKHHLQVDAKPFFCSTLVSKANEFLDSLFETIFSIHSIWSWPLLSSPLWHASSCTLLMIATTIDGRTKVRPIWLLPLVHLNLPHQPLTQPLWKSVETQVEPVHWRWYENLTHLSIISTPPPHLCVFLEFLNSWIFRYFLFVFCTRKFFGETRF